MRARSTDDGQLSFSNSCLGKHTFQCPTHNGETAGSATQNCSSSAMAAVTAGDLGSPSADASATRSAALAAVASATVIRGLLARWKTGRPKPVLTPALGFRSMRRAGRVPKPAAAGSAMSDRRCFMCS